VGGEQQRFAPGAGEVHDDIRQICAAVLLCALFGLLNGWLQAASLERRQNSLPDGRVFRGTHRMG